MPVFPRTMGIPRGRPSLRGSAGGRGEAGTGPREAGSPGAGSGRGIGWEAWRLGGPAPRAQRGEGAWPARSPAPASPAR